jgi:hypothetical protein
MLSSLRTSFNVVEVREIEIQHFWVQNRVLYLHGAELFFKRQVTQVLILFYNTSVLKVLISFIFIITLNPALKLKQNSSCYNADFNNYFVWLVLNFVCSLHKKVTKMAEHIAFHLHSQ